MSKMTKMLAVTAIALTLSACYVVPINHQYPNGYSSSGTAIMPVAAVRSPFTARLYPANDSAARQGGASGLISNPEHGHGQFSFALGGESYTGEATRTGNSANGVANATGSKGGYARCTYAMSSSERGSGSCTFSNGARYDMHISQ